jgi:hypothetical protein
MKWVTYIVYHLYFLFRLVHCTNTDIAGKGKQRLRSSFSSRRSNRERPYALDQLGTVHKSDIRNGLMATKPSRFLHYHLCIEICTMTN